MIDADSLGGSPAFHVFQYGVFCQAVGVFEMAGDHSHLEVFHPAFMETEDAIYGPRCGIPKVLIQLRFTEVEIKFTVGFMPFYMYPVRTKSLQSWVRFKADLRNDLRCAEYRFLQKVEEDFTGFPGPVLFSEEILRFPA